MIFFINNILKQHSVRKQIFKLKASKKLRNANAKFILNKKIMLMMRTFFET